MRRNDERLRPPAGESSRGGRLDRRCFLRGVAAATAMVGGGGAWAGPRPGEDDSVIAALYHSFTDAQKKDQQEQEKEIRKDLDKDVDSIREAKDDLPPPEKEAPAPKKGGKKQKDPDAEPGTESEEPL